MSVCGVRVRVSVCVCRDLWAGVQGVWNVGSEVWGRRVSQSLYCRCGVQTQIGVQVWSLLISKRVRRSPAPDTALRVVSVCVCAPVTEGSVYKFTPKH